MELTPKKALKLLKKAKMPEQELLSFPGGKLVADMNYGEKGVRDSIAFHTAIHWWKNIRTITKKKKRSSKKKVTKR